MKDVLTPGLTSYDRARALGLHRAFTEAAKERLFPIFNKIEEEAEAYQEAEWERVCNMPARYAGPEASLDLNLSRRKGSCIRLPTVPVILFVPVCEDPPPPSMVKREIVDCAWDGCVVANNSATQIARSVHFVISSPPLLLAIRLDPIRIDGYRTQRGVFTRVRK